ncbi:MAG: rod shape-determining protein MreC [Gammaproteobacteria bacterium]|nr:rod shape-determining protein MreC [Gammaproteobacteria bacterium]
MRLAALVVLSILLMTLDHRQQHLQDVRAALSLFVYPIQYVFNIPVSAGRWFSENVMTRQELLEENASLSAQRLLLEVRLQKLDVLKIENMRLRQLLDSSIKVNEKVLIAELLAVDLEPFSRQVTLNKGRRQGVYVGQPLLDAYGIMGQTVRVGPLTSKAMLITDPSHALPVQVNRNNLRAIAVGSGSPELIELQHLPNNADIVMGDLLLTSGLGGRFPRDYPVAIVTQVVRDPGEPFAKVSAHPLAHLEDSREVLLVWPTTVQAVEDEGDCVDDECALGQEEGAQ